LPATWICKTLPSISNNFRPPPNRLLESQMSPDRTLSHMAATSVVTGWCNQTPVLAGVAFSFFSSRNWVTVRHANAGRTNRFSEEPPASHWLSSGDAAFPVGRGLCPAPLPADSAGGGTPGPTVGADVSAGLKSRPPQKRWSCLRRQAAAWTRLALAARRTGDSAFGAGAPGQKCCRGEKEPGRVWRTSRRGRKVLTFR